MKKGKCKAFSSSTTLLWNVFSLLYSFLPSFLPSFLSLFHNPRTRLRYLKRFTGLCTKKVDVLFVMDFFLSLNKKITRNIFGKGKKQKQKSQKRTI